MLNYGFGVSHLLFDSDAVALVPTLELVGWTALEGEKTPPTGTAIPVDGDTIFNLYPGLRMIMDNGGDLGIFEMGLQGGLNISGNHWYESLLRLELRWIL